MTSPLISAAEFHASLGGGEPVHVLDIRWRLDRDDPRSFYLAGHVPGAVYVDLDSELAAHGRPAHEGRHPLPDERDLEASARAWGLRRGEPVVVYDDSRGLSAARAWWLLRYAGIDDVRVLDGGFSAWTAAGLPVETDDVRPEPGDVALRLGAFPTLDTDAVAEFDGVLLDARAAERYRGEVEPIDPRAGHVPGAVSAPTTENLGPDGLFLPPAVLRERFRALGVTPESPVAVYCGSGVTAAHEALALQVAGFEPALYPGSWSAWANTDRPVAIGATPEPIGRGQPRIATARAIQRA